MQRLSTFIIVFMVPAIFTEVKGFEENEKIYYGRKVELYRNDDGVTKELISGKITTFSKTTMQACMKACKLRKSCAFVNFHFKTNFCYLLRATEAGETSTFIDNDGYGLGVKSLWDMTNYLTCNACSDNEICNVETGNCTIGECRKDRIDTSLPYYYNGNNFHIGMKIVYYCDMYYEMVVHTTASSTCLSDGSWSTTNFACTEVNECESDPCQNGGTCNDMLGSYTCSCAAGWEGIHCETEIDECDSTPCLNGGQCTDMVNGYTCSCSPGFLGNNCETDINECASSPCGSGSTCVDGVNRYTCSCAPGYTGNNCQTDINECDSTPCLNGGQCSDIVNGYTCSCSSGFGGSNCETDINECASNPCRSGSTCVDKVNEYTCNCAQGYTGNNCQTEINECASSPCESGSTCVDIVNGYTCTCAPGYTGNNCQTALTCSVGWTYYANSCYRLEAYKAKNSVAKQTCNSMGGHLADVTSQAEMNFLQQLYEGSNSIYATDGVWVSTNDIADEDRWVLSDGQLATYLNWHTGQPDGEIPKDDCVQVWPNENFQWNDVYCDYSYWFFCEKEI